ncbi:Alpha/Beta hydrolase protein [Chytriomyces sp. MP71]|nr:Alpha/Beta hydrolase protein [Chytriomyces sp. MP71]
MPRSFPPLQQPIFTSLYIYRYPYIYINIKYLINYYNDLLLLFNVLTYDIYGRGYSAAPGIKYSGDDYARQLHDLMEHIGWKKASVMGYSLGGGVAATFADSHSDKVDDLLFVAPAGLMRDLPPAAKFLSTTILGSLISYTVGRRMISKRSRGNHNPIYINQPHMQLFCDVQDLNILLHPGFLRAYIATGLNGPVRNMDSVYARLGTKFGSRIFCLWGRHDTVCNFKEQALLFKSLVPQATFVEVDSGHYVFPDTCEKVLEPAVEFLNCRLA